MAERNVKNETEWLKENYKRIEIRYRKGEQDLVRLEELASKSNETLSELIKTAIVEKLKKEDIKENEKMTDEQKLAKWTEIVKAYFENEKKSDYIRTIDIVNPYDHFDDQFCEDYSGETVRVCDDVADEFGFESVVCDNGDGFYVKATKKAYQAFEKEYENLLSGDHEFYKMFNKFYAK